MLLQPGESFQQSQHVFVAVKLGNVKQVRLRNAQPGLLGHQVVGDIGNGQVACPDGTTEVARIQYGIEGGVCCQAAAAPAGE